MARSRSVAYKKNKGNRIANLLIILVVCALFLVVSVSSINLRNKLNDLRAREQDIQRQIEAAAGKLSVFLGTCSQQRQKLGVLFQKQAGFGLIILDDPVVTYTEAGGDDQIQQIDIFCLFIHCDPPDANSMCRMGKNFPGGFRQVLLLYILSKTVENSNSQECEIILDGRNRNVNA